MVRRLFLFVVVASICLASCAEAPLSPREPTPGVPHFTVQTYNVNLDHSNNNSTLNAVGAADADVVALIETNIDWEIALRGRYAEQYPHMLFRHPESGAGGLAILSKQPLTDAGFHAGLDNWHPAWHVEAETPVGVVQFLIVHLKPPVTKRDGIDIFEIDDIHTNEITLFQASCDDEIPTIVLGDFNEGPNGAAVAYLEKSGFRNALPLYRPGQNTWRYEKAFLGQTSEAIDHILFDPTFVSLNAFVLDKGASDHYPVVAHLELTR